MKLKNVLDEICINFEVFRALVQDVGWFFRVGPVRLKWSGDLASRADHFRLSGQAVGRVEQIDSVKAVRRRRR